MKIKNKELFILVLMILFSVGISEFLVIPNVVSNPEENQWDLLVNIVFIFVAVLVFNFWIRTSKKDEK